MDKTMRYAAHWLAATAILCVGVVFLGPAHAQENKNAQCLSNAKQVALAFLMYTQDYDGAFPPMNKAEKFAKALFPYTKNKVIFVCPANGKPYTPNTTLNSKKLKNIKAPTSTVLLYDGDAHSDGLFTVAYVDGHVKREKKAPVLQEKRAKKKPGK